MSSQNICSSNVKSNFILYNKKSIVRLDRGLTFEENRGLRDLEFRNRPSLVSSFGKIRFHSEDDRDVRVSTRVR